MQTAIRAVLTIISLAFLVFIVVASFAVHAQTKAPPGTAVDKDTTCGAAATGRSRITRDVVQMQMPGNRVDADGYWTSCDRACGGSRRFVEWSQGPHRCTSADRLATSPDSPQRLQGALHGQSETIRQTSGDMRGAVTYTCSDGTYTQTAATCELAPTILRCTQPIDVTAGRCRFRHDGQGADGDQIAIRPRPGQGDMRARCWAGVWLAQSIYCAAR